MKSAIAAALTLLLAAGAAQAQNAGQAIAERQAGFKAIAAATGDVKKVLDASGDLKSVAGKATEIAAFARKMPSLFPAGSGPEAGIKTRALAPIWENKGEFEFLAGNLGREADKLFAALNAGDKAAATAAFGAVGGACGACHRPYRAPQ